MNTKYDLQCRCDVFEWKFCLKVEIFGWWVTRSPDVNKPAGGWEFPESDRVDMLVSVVRFRRHNAALGQDLTSASKFQVPLMTPKMEKTHKVKLEPFLSVTEMQTRRRPGRHLSNLRHRRSSLMPSLKTTSLLLQVRLFQKIVSRLLCHRRCRDN